MIKTLVWDSNFFKARIGRLDVLNRLSKESFYEEAKDYDLVYIFSNKPIYINAKLVDIKVTFHKDVKHHILNSHIVKFNKNKHSYNQLLKLAYLSGHESRFKKDSFFLDKDFKRLYQKWLDNNIHNSNENVLVYVIGEKIVGFVSYEKKASKAFIHLIAVDSNQQGKGIGKQLMQAVENNLKISSTLFVPTQQANTIAVKFYENYGFRLKQKNYIYHYSNDTI